MTEPAKAVFLSYASQDAEAAQRICDALRAAGIEVWFDQSELRGGDVWDQKIRHQIRDCALFIPIISANTQARPEGYFRLEWRLADQRTHLMGRSRAFLVPVCIDNTPDLDADAPDSFLAIQWTRLPAGETSTVFTKRVAHLLSPEAAPAPAEAGSTAAAVPQATAALRQPASGPAISRQTQWVVLIAVLAVVGVGYLAVDKFWISSSATPSSAARFAPPPHSIAVLPFVNMSGDPKQEYFSEGLTEELLNSLSRINELQVAARTSSFSFQGEHPDIATVAHKLNVGAVLEGSVRRSAHTIRVTAQLINAVSGFHLWSQTYDRDLGDVLKLQTEIATTVASSLRVALLEGTGRRIELGGTSDPAAFDAYLRGLKIARTADSAAETRAALAAYTDAVQHDPDFATAFAERSVELTNFADFDAHGAEAGEAYDRALADARTAVRLAPDLALGHYVLGVARENFLQIPEASEEFERAAELAPGSARIQAAYSRHSAQLRHTAAALSAGRRAIALDPLNFHVHRTVGIALLLSRRYSDALAAFETAISLQPDYLRNHVLLGAARYELGDLQGSRAACEVAAATLGGKVCLAKTYQKLGRRADAEAELQALRASSGDEGALDYAAIYAQWGEVAKALEWLETAWRLRDSSLAELKAEPDLDPLRNEPRFQAIERELKFPD
ncbi:MAG TPA: TIR domain-containing protein [Steroidobacteraceae bacterium]|nr:TIR domain-containing protein [Steroidobacteraceae bacterium]